jgi:cytochrome b561
MTVQNTPRNATAADMSGYQPVGLRNTARGYGLVAIVLHWLVALTVIGLFALGFWMTGLTYYDDWYRRGPDLHKSIGIVLFMVMLVRVVWRSINIKPEDEPGISAFERQVARSVHLLFYVLLFALMISGYLISTADGRPIQVFDLFAVPATLSDLPQQEDIAGAVHWYLALLLISLASLHALAALKHHFIDRDRTLKKMLGIRSHQ